ncbi:Ras-related protein, partial [Drosera capensis]
MQGSSIRNQIYRGADCCVLVYTSMFSNHLNPSNIGTKSSSSRSSHMDIQDSTKFSFVLIGNKIDIDGGIIRTVAEKTAKEWCKLNGDIPYFETSAKENVNVHVAFQCVATAALSHEPYTDICDSLTKDSSIKIARTCSFAPPRLTSYWSNYNFPLFSANSRFMHICCLIFTFLYCTYPRDRELARLQALKEEAQEE